MTTRRYLVLVVAYVLVGLTFAWIAAGLLMRSIGQ